MTKAQIVSHFAQKFELSKKTSSVILDEVAALVVSETKKTGSFTLPGIGKLVLAKRKARMGRNPATGEAIKIPAKTVVKMRESRGVVWAGNKILYVASDALSAAFQYEIRQDEVVTANLSGVMRAEGAIQLDRPLQEMYGGIYFPIPPPLEPFLVPRGDAEICLELHCDWIDMRTAKHWTPKESLAD